MRVRFALLDLQKHAADESAEEERYGQNEWKRNDGNCRQAWLLGEQDRENRNRHEQPVEESDERHAGCHPDRVHVIGRSRHQVAYLALVEVAGLERHELPEQLLAELCLDPAGRTVDEETPSEPPYRNDERDADHLQHQRADHSHVELSGGDLVDRFLEKLGYQNLTAARDRKAENPRRICCGMLAEVGQQSAELSEHRLLLLLAVGDERRFVPPRGDLLRDCALRQSDCLLDRGLVTGMAEHPDQPGPVGESLKPAEELLHRHEPVAAVDCDRGDGNGRLREDRPNAAGMKCPDDAVARTRSFREDYR